MLDWTGTHIHEVVKRYLELHPEIAEPLDKVLDPLILCDKIIRKVRNKL